MRAGAAADRHGAVELDELVGDSLEPVAEQDRPHVRVHKLPAKLVLSPWAASRCRHRTRAMRPS